jgi:hypothetical protein
MKINWTFILIILLILLFFFIGDFFYIVNNFASLYKNYLNQYKLIIVSNKNYILLHFKNIFNGSNQIFKIYKNKFYFNH